MIATHPETGLWMEIDADPTKATHRMVNGEPILLLPDEAAALEAEWAENAKLESARREEEQKRQAELDAARAVVEDVKAKLTEGKATEGEKDEMLLAMLKLIR